MIRLAVEKDDSLHGVKGGWEQEGAGVRAKVIRASAVSAPPHMDPEMWLEWILQISTQG